MSSQGPDALIKSYLDDIERAVAPLPARQRRKLIDDISSRIAAARLGLDFESEAAVREMLDRLGVPASIAAAATAESSPSERTEHRREDSVITWLLFGGLLVGVGWLVGVNRLWRSPVWSRSEKLLGTLVVPGGLLWAFTLEPRQVAAPGGAFRWPGPSGARSLCCCRSGARRSWCFGGDGSTPPCWRLERKSAFEAENLAAASPARE